MLTQGQEVNPILHTILSEPFKATFMSAWEDSFLHIYPEEDALMILDDIQRGFMDYLSEYTDDLDETLQAHLVEHASKITSALLDQFACGIANLARGYGDDLFRRFQLEMIWPGYTKNPNGDGIRNALCSPKGSMVQ